MSADVGMVGGARVAVTREAVPGGVRITVHAHPLPLQAGLWKGAVAVLRPGDDEVVLIRDAVEVLRDHLVALLVSSA